MKIRQEPLSLKLGHTWRKGPGAWTDVCVLHMNSNFYFTKIAGHHNVLFKTPFEFQCGRGPGGRGDLIACKLHVLPPRPLLPTATNTCLTAPSPVTHCYQYNKQKIIEPPCFSYTIFFILENEFWCFLKTNRVLQRLQ